MTMSYQLRHAYGPMRKCRDFLLGQASFCGWEPPRPETIEWLQGYSYMLTTFHLLGGEMLPAICDYSPPPPVSVTPQPKLFKPQKPRPMRVSIPWSKRPTGKARVILKDFLAANGVTRFDDLVRHVQQKNISLSYGYIHRLLRSSLDFVHVRRGFWKLNGRD